MEYWLSVYLYCNENQTHYLLNKVVKGIVKKHLYCFKRYFFIQYYDEFGFHLRVRFLISDKKKFNQVILDLESRYKKFRHRNLNSVFHREFSGIRYVAYEQEIKRYGGNESIAIVEKQFQLSSDICIKMLKIIDYTDYSLRLGIALKLNMIFLLSMGEDKNVLKLFLKEMIYAWIPRSIIAITPFVISEQRKVSNSEVEICICYFMDMFNKSKDNLISSIETTIIEINDFMSSNKGNSIYIDWFKDNLEVINELKILDSKGRLHNTYLLENKMSNSLVVCFSLMHMINNRLGIKNHDEAYLAFILLQGLIENESL